MPVTSDKGKAGWRDGSGLAIQNSSEHKGRLKGSAEACTKSNSTTSLATRRYSKAPCFSRLETQPC